jgi:hypothetical protein
MLSSAESYSRVRVRNVTYQTSPLPPTLLRAAGFNRRRWPEMIDSFADTRASGGPCYKTEHDWCRRRGYR